MKIHIIFKSLKSFGNSEFQKESKATVVNNNEINRFHPNDIDFFNLLYDNKTINIVFIIKHSDKSIYFRDIYVFIDRVKDVTRIKNDMLL